MTTKRCLIFCIVLFLQLYTVAQMADTSKIRQLQREAEKSFLPQQLMNRLAMHGTPVSPALLLQPAAAKALLQKIPAQANDEKRVTGNIHPPAARPAGLCKDTSYTRLLGVTHAQLYIQSVTQTSDYGFLLTALMIDTTRLPNPSWRTFGLLIRMDEGGNILWLKQFEDLTPGLFNLYWLDNAFELPNKDVICTGLFSTDNVAAHYTTHVYRLSSQGTLLWKTRLENNVSIYNSGAGTFTYYVKSAAEGFNGDVILCGSSNSNLGSGHMETVVRLDKQGKLVWDANYKNYGTDGSYRPGAEGIKAFIKNGQIILVGLSHGSTYEFDPPAVHVSVLDYATGNEVSKRFFRPDYPGNPYTEQFYKSFVFYTNKCTLLANGHLIIHGKLFSDFISQLPVIHHFGVIELDESFNLVNAYTISSGISTGYYLNLLHFDTSGKGLISVFENLNNDQCNLYFGAFSGQQFQNIRKVFYPNAVLPGNNGFAYLPDGGYAYIQTWAQNQPDYKSYFEFRKMHNSDTASACLGTSSLPFNFLPLHIIEDPGYPYLDANEPNKISELTQNVSITDTLTTSTINPCRQTNYCDSVKIHGDTVICGGTPSLVFTSFKNKACGSITQWAIDPAAIDSLKVLTDSSVSIWFKNINWQGKLLATLPAGACYLPAKDAVTINIVRSQVLLDLGNDTVLCPGNKMILNAHKGFGFYKWQDGSTDSIFTVTQPGKYWVDVTNGCGGNFTDTILVSPHPPISFSLGSDVSVCANKSIVLNAPAGFINYQWSSQYAIAQPSSADITVSPQVNTDFMVQAEQTRGCFAYDTISVLVQQIPSIHLGNDTSLCAGKSLPLNAGAGFNSYSWSTGEQQQQIVVNRAGVYSVVVTLNSCTATDTLTVLTVNPLPVFSLGGDTTLCSDERLSINLSLPQATYQWSNGNTNNSLVITQPGIYWLAATQNGCTTIDTISIAYTPVPVVKLAQDTTLCQGQTILLNAFNNGADYLWQNGSSAATLLVTTAGNYSVAANIGNCKAADTIAVQYIAVPEFTLGKDSFICMGQQMILSPVVNTAAAYLWQDGSTGPSYAVTHEGLYSLQTTNRCGSYTDEVLVTEGPCNIVMPSAFSPNGDGLNDVFRVKFPFTVQEFSLVIYNRYGEKVFETTDIHQGWNGIWKGEPQLQNSYVWTIHFKDINNLQQALKGMVTLLR